MLGQLVLRRCSDSSKLVHVPKSKDALGAPQLSFHRTSHSSSSTQGMYWEPRSKLRTSVQAAPMATTAHATTAAAHAAAPPVATHTGKQQMEGPGFEVALLVSRLLDFRGRVLRGAW